MELNSGKTKDQHSLNATFVNLGFDKETVGYSILDLQKVLVPKKEISMSRNLLQVIKNNIQMFNLFRGRMEHPAGNRALEAERGTLNSQ